MTTPTAPTTAKVIPLPITPKDTRRAEAKFGKPVMTHGYTVVPNLLFQAQAHLGISPTAFNVLLQLMMHWWDADEAPHPKIETVARRMRRSPRSLFRYFDELEDAGLVKRQHRYRGEKAQTSSAYVLTGLTAKLKAIEPEFTKAKKFKGKRVEKAETASTAA
jgi:predicted transcriptional regulator